MTTRRWAIALAIAVAFSLLGIAAIVAVEFFIGNGTLLDKIWIPLILIGILTGIVSTFAILRRIRNGWYRTVTGLCLLFASWFLANIGIDIAPYGDIIQSIAMAGMLTALLGILSVPVRWITSKMRTNQTS